MQDANRYSDGRLCAKPLSKVSIEPELEHGTHQLKLANGGKADFYLPRNHRAKHPAPLLLAFHGASGIDGGLVAAAIKWAGQQDALVLAPKAFGISWDLLRGDFGIDASVTDTVLDWVMQRYMIDAARIGIAGFSDGASYALSLGLSNGDLFSHIFAFSPGFMRPAAQIGKPRIMVTHGVTDKILPVDCSRSIVERLKSGGYAVDFHEFDGGHNVPLAMAANAFMRVAAKD